MFAFIAYRAQLNAGLNVRILDIPIKSWEDVLMSDKDFLIWMGTSIEMQFRESPKGSVMRNIYEKKVLTTYCSITPGR